MQTVSGSKISTEPLYVLLTPYILTEELLCSNGFPRPHPEEKGVAIMHVPPGTVRRTPLSPDRKRVLRTCCRCNQGYSVNKNGFQLKEEQCFYHWGRLFQTRGRW
jgi:RNA exonuclease 1